MNTALTSTFGSAIRKGGFVKPHVDIVHLSEQAAYFHRGRPVLLKEEPSDSHVPTLTEDHSSPLDSPSTWMIAEDRSDYIPSPMLMVPPLWQALDAGAPRRIPASSPGPGALSPVTEVSCIESQVYSPSLSDLSMRAIARTSSAISDPVSIMNGPSSPSYSQLGFRSKLPRTASALDLSPRQQRTLVTPVPISPYFGISPPVHRSPMKVEEQAVSELPPKDYDDCGKLISTIDEQQKLDFKLRSRSGKAPTPTLPQTVDVQRFR
ncbi:hypothetical protein FOMPIDRAFT_86816 [Fomitopsis schrenkii]|uniref:Uncharacterized protein n=1 Tax=Fomitopsis schrenkii TaxID=2126942 RepID=S8F5N4_FOMSC|nr:hypothetical protein FOMPIDRAFT_86816 [Fomitopsis schrenkii]